MLWFFQVHLPVHLPCYDLPPLWLFILLGIVCVEIGESDGRCVRASGPVSAEHSTLCLLLNPPLTTRFHYGLRKFVKSTNVAHFFPSHTLHLDLTFWGVPILLTVDPSQGKLTTAVYRRVKQGRVRLNGGYRF